MAQHGLLVDENNSNDNDQNEIGLTGDWNIEFMESMGLK